MQVIDSIIPTITANSGITDETYTAWSDSITPTKGSYYLHDSTIYRSVDGTKTPQNPKAHLSDPANAKAPKWVDYGKINSLRAFDDRNTSQTEGVNIVYTLEVGQSNILALFNLENVAKIKVEILTDEDGNGYQVKKTVEDSNISFANIADWLGYINARVTYNKSYILSLPAYFENKQLKITLSNGNNKVKVGNAITGDLITLGETLITLSGSTLDYTKAKTTEAGYTTLSKGLHLRLIDVPIYNLNVDLFAGLVDPIMGKPTAFIPTEGIKSSIIYGFIKSRRDGFNPKGGEHILSIQELS